MLALKPSCEHCARALPPESPEARICSFECTFCRSCVEEVLSNVCPNCGGGFVPRPIRPREDRVGGNSVRRFPPSADSVHRPLDLERQAALVAVLGEIPPEAR